MRISVTDVAIHLLWCSFGVVRGKGVKLLLGGYKMTMKGCVNQEPV